MYKTLLGLGAFIAVLLLVVGLSFSAASERPADFRFINESETPTLDPQLTTDSVGGRMAHALFEGLTRQDAKSLLPAPGVAERWETSADQKVYTFHLRKDAKWSDGVAITAADFVYSWRRLQEPELGAEYAYILHMVRHAEALNTFAALATTLREQIGPAFKEWKKTESAAVPASSWQRFLRAQQFHNLVRHVDNAEFSRVVQRNDGLISGQELAQVEGWFNELADSLVRRADYAVSHFGVDQGIYAKDAHTLVVELNAPTPYFLDLTSFYPSFPVPRHVVQEQPRAWFLPQTIVSNGPFRLESWKVNDRIRLVRSDTYWGKAEVRLGIIDALPTENAMTAINLYLTDAVDWLPKSYPPDLVDELKKRSDFFANAGMAVYYYRLNTTKPPFNDARVREALSLAIDRELIVSQVMRLGQIPAYGFVPPGLRGYRSPEVNLRLDVPRAKALLAAAGFPDGKGFPRVGLLYNTNEDHKKVAEVVADQLRKHLGIEVVPYNQEWQSFLATCRSMDFEMARAAWIGDYLDPNTFLDMWVTNGGNNQTGFSSQEYDALIRAAANMDVFVRDFENLAPLALPEPETRARFASAIAAAMAQSEVAERANLLQQVRMQLLAQAEELLFTREFPVIPVYFYVHSNLVKPKVKGFYTELVLPDGSRTPNLQDLHPLRDIWIEREAVSP